MKNKPVKKRTTRATETEIRMAWKKFQELVKRGASTEKLVSAAFGAYRVQYGDGMTEKLVDKGVALVFEKVRQAEASDATTKDIGKRYTDFNRCLARNGANSFFAQLAIGSASAVLAKADFSNRAHDFSWNYVSSIFSHVIIRDLALTLGNVGLINFDRLDSLLEAASQCIEAKASGYPMTSNQCVDARSSEYRVETVEDLRDFLDRLAS
jgi:hypothetical protein